MEEHAGWQLQEEVLLLLLPLPLLLQQQLLMMISTTYVATATSLTSLSDRGSHQLEPEAKTLPLRLQRRRRGLSCWRHRERKQFKRRSINSQIRHLASSFLQHFFSLQQPYRAAIRTRLFLVVLLRQVQRALCSCVASLWGGDGGGGAYERRAVIWGLGS
jgi:hypothetical protein